VTGVQTCALPIFEREILHQVYDDGGDYESSTGYHVLVAQMFTTAYLVMRAAGDQPSACYRARLESMYCLMYALANRQGALPHIGDCDDGRVELLSDDLEQMVTLDVSDRDSLRVIGLLGLGDALFDLGYNASSADNCWYGSKSPASRKQVSSSGIWQQTGVAVHRCGDAQIVFCALPNGIHGKGSHTHNDKLSVLLRIGGKDFLCDRGTGVYTRDTAKRNSFRSTASHNTIVINGAEQNSIWSETSQVFRIGREAEVTPIELSKHDGVITFTSSHNGYRRFGVIHSRSVRSLTDDSLLIEDEMQGSGSHSFQLNFWVPDNWRILPDPRMAQRIVFHDSRHCVEMKWSGRREVTVGHEVSTVSRTYGGLSSVLRVYVDGRSEFPLRLETRIAWSLL